MTAILFALVVIALIGYGLERNHARVQRGQLGQPQSRLAGSTDVVDRDAERVVAELRAVGSPT